MIIYVLLVETYEIDLYITISKLFISFAAFTRDLNLKQ